MAKLTRKQVDAFKEQAKRAGVKALREFGYPNCTTDNICSDFVYGMCFLSQLIEARDVAKGFRKDTLPLDELIAEVQKHQDEHKAKEAT